MMKPVAQRMQTLTPHFFASLRPKLEVMQAAGCDVIRLDEGSPDLPPADHIIGALARSAALSDRHGYQPHLGTEALRSAWAGMYRRVFAVELDPEREIAPLLGSKEGIFHLALAFVEPGEVVLVPDPGYITYTRGARFAGAEVVYLPLLAERGFLPDLQSIPADITQRAKLLWLNYPNNPTAATAPLEFFADAVEFARQNDILLCHDAAYTQVTYDGYRAPSLLQVPGAKEVAVEFNTLSKSHNMAGWRVGVAAGNPQILKSLHTLKTNADSGHFLPVMEAATQAMNGDQSWLEERNETYRRRRDIVIRALQDLGLPVQTPRASLYVWCPVTPGLTSLEFVTTILDAANVSLTPGTVFGERGEGYFRLSLTAPEERIVEAMGRMKKALNQENWLEKVERRMG